MKKYSHLTVGIIAGLLFIVVYNMSAFAFKCTEIRNDTIRLHVIANSDTDEDQEVKLMVRNAILTAGQNIFDGTVNTENAFSKITNELNEIENVANETLRKNNKQYFADAELVTEYFDTRIYNDNITLPAGKYLALKIVLGEGKGKNWWCVMFPSLCLPAVEKTNADALKSVYSESEKHIVLNQKKYEYRFKIIEIIETIKDHVDN